MAKPSRTSRKNKKAWRRNVDASDLEAGLERKAAARIAAATAAAEEAAADAELFFVDKDAAASTSASAAAAAAAASSSRRRLKGAAALKRPLRCQLVTARPPVARRVPASLEKPLKKNTKVSSRKTKVSPLVVPATPPPRSSSSSALVAAAAAAPASTKLAAVDQDTGLPLAAPEDVWKPSRFASADGAAAKKASGGNLVAAAELAAATATAAARRAVSSLGASAASFVASSAAEVVVPKIVAPRRRRLPRVAPIPAVEVDAAGCSYNPDAEQHQDAVGAAVAAELAKEAKRLALMKAAPPRLVEGGLGGGGRDELSRLLADTAEAVSSSDDDEGGEEEERDEEGEGTSSSDGDSDGDDDGGVAAKKKSFSSSKDNKDPRRKTTAERNRAARAKALQIELAARRAAKLQRADLASLSTLQQRLRAAEEARALALARRAADRAERERERPPHLGRKKWAPTDVQVLPTDEITGSLLKLRPCAAVSRDRFASLQKRGRIEVRTPAPKKTKRAIKLYEPEGRSDRLVEAQEALDRERRANKEAAARM